MFEFVDQLAKTTFNCTNFVLKHISLDDLCFKAQSIKNPGSSIFLCNSTPNVKIFIEYAGLSNDKRVYRFVEKSYYGTEVINYSHRFTL